jgi:hypothetical protein
MRARSVLFRSRSSSIFASSDSTVSALSRAHSKPGADRRMSAR